MKRLGLLILFIAAAAALWTSGVADPWIHPARHRVSGTGLLPLDSYADAAARALPAGTGLARLTLPDGRAPVTVEATDGSLIYLDPPTAAVLDVEPGDPQDAAARPPLPVLPLTAVLLAARPLVNGAPLRRIDWPGGHAPDWTLRFAGRGRGATVKVADDTGTATPARAERASVARAARGPWAWIGAAAVLGAALVALGLRRRPKRR
ncbi:hypothetical protein GCM10011380_17000 [Sphingomonas metalli]|uniref:PepSY domain-containing protein n=1 Tax=Sphingomonas metalli TaxID=1779358 RepID=A0A916WTD6_9SPHN|nr:hypothetical protein [Sphingomonas metalli]GGB28021.1 hypothetical protein GCM10011380_17000 [Sphingomonas metalli]